MRRYYINFLQVKAEFRTILIGLIEVKLFGDLCLVNNKNDIYCKVLVLCVM